MKIQPLGKRILVKPEEKETKTPSGLYIPAGVNEDKKPSIGEVVKLGTADKDKFKMKIGDKVYFEKYTPKEIEIENEKYLVVDIDDVIAIIE